MKHIHTYESFLNESKSKVSDIEEIDYACSVYNGRLMSSLYKIYVKMKGIEKHKSFGSIESFNKEFGTNLSSSLNQDPDRFVKEVTKILPGVKVILSDFDVS